MMIPVLVFASFVSVYIFMRAILPLRIHWGWKAGLAVVLLATAQKFHILHLIGGLMYFAPSVPGFILLISAWAYGIVFIFFFLLIAADLVRILYRLYLIWRKRKTEKHHRIEIWTNLFLFLLAAVLATVGIWNGLALPEVQKVDIAIEKLPPEAEGTTIAVLADIHVDNLTRAPRVRKIVERINSLNPDIIVLVGDFVDGRVSGHGADLLPLKELSAKRGVFGVPGNHEYYSGYAEWMRFLPTLGIRMLLNEHALPENGIVIAGVTDPAANRLKEERPNPIKALAGIPEGSVKILLSHQPRIARNAERAGADLMISGHTHGGIVLGMHWAVAKFNRGFVSGKYRVGKMTLYVTNGSGIWNGFPLRLGVPSEITLIRLTAKP